MDVPSCQPSCALQSMNKLCQPLPPLEGVDMVYGELSY